MAAIADNLLSNCNEVQSIFRDASISGTGHELRLMFTLLTLQGFPTLQYLDNSEVITMMTSDYNYSAYVIQSRESFFNELLKDIAELLQENGRTLEDFGFPIPLNITTEMQQHRIKYGDAEQQQIFLQELNNNSPNTADQELIWQSITKSISNNETKIYLIQAKGGAGKTTLAKKIIAFARSIHKIMMDLKQLIHFFAFLLLKIKTKTSVIRLHVTLIQSQEDENYWKLQMLLCGMNFFQITKSFTRVHFTL